MKGFSFYRTTPGKKVVMASTGVILLLFLVGHMAGNLKTFFGFDASGVHKLDHYAAFLRTIGEAMLGHGTFLWIVRGVLFLAAVLHIVTALQLSAINRAARPISYARTKYSSANPASRTMVIGGLILAAFIVFHILHMTTGDLHFYGFMEGRVYSNVYNAFIHWQLALLYVVAMCVLWSHLYHGTWSLFQTLGIESPGWNCCIRRFVQTLVLIVCLGFMSVPIAIYFRCLPPPNQVPAELNQSN